MSGAREAVTLSDDVGFVVALSSRSSFSPDAAFYAGELKGGQFLDGAPIFAVFRRMDLIELHRSKTKLNYDSGEGKTGLKIASS